MVRRRIEVTISAVLAAACTLASTSGLAAPGEAACTKLATASFPNTTIGSAKEIPADATAKTAAFCEVTAVVAPVQGSHIGVVYRLPDNWNGKLLGLGGGGWAGNVRLETAVPGLAKGYATAQTDAGHESTTTGDTRWAASAPAIDDFAYHGIHVMTTTGKAVVAKYYGAAQKHAYFQGCSTGGRQALMEVQRYPDDYNGVIAGAPVYTLTTQTMALLRRVAFAKPGAQLTAGQLKHLSEVVLNACDAQDGLKDGIVTDPRMCRFDPATIQCKTGEAADSCLSPAQVTAVRTIYSGVRAPSGEYAAYPLARGSEASWGQYIANAVVATSSPTASGAGLDGLRQALFGNADFDLTTFSADKDFKTVRTSAFAQKYEAKDPNIAPFISKGGKLILWHGFDDAGPSPLATVDYYENVRKVTADKAGPLDASFRFFLDPGVYHCRGGPGADQFDSIAALEGWVEQGKAPDTMLASRADGKLSRPLCQYPKLPVYTGGGAPNSAASFECKK